MQTISWPKISVVTPVKNSVHTLEKAIKSLIDQNYPNLEYIVLDGGSEDGTVDIIKKYEKYINHWSSDKNCGAVDAYVDGIKIATSDIIAFLNADDFYEPGILQKVAQEFIKDPTLEIVSFPYRVVAFNNSTKEYETLEESTKEVMLLSKETPILNISPNCRFFKRELFYKYGFPSLKDDKGRMFLSNDHEYMMRFALLGVKNIVIDIIGYNYLSHEDSLSFSHNLERRKIYFEDKIYLAKKFLTDKNFVLSKLWEKDLKKWIKRYRAKVIKVDLSTRNFQSAKENLMLGVKESGIGFLFYLFKRLLHKKI